ncbi:MAG: hypothetical protein V1856_03525 [Candidatus Liptonbacteria bacterium]
MKFWSFCDPELLAQKLVPDREGRIIVAKKAIEGESSSHACLELFAEVMSFGDRLLMGLFLFKTEGMILDQIGITACSQMKNGGTLIVFSDSEGRVCVDWVTKPNPVLNIRQVFS